MTIPSFQVDHTRLKRGIYVSRKDCTSHGDVVTTFDIRVKEPNKSSMLAPAAHTIEHIGATFLRNSPLWKDDIVYFGPMGCLTGFYLIIKGDYESWQIVDLVKTMFRGIIMSKEIPGATKEQCGNADFHDMQSAKNEAKEFVEFLDNITAENLSYPK